MEIPARFPLSTTIAHDRRPREYFPQSGKPNGGFLIRDRQEKRHDHSKLEKRSQ
jgi:hypothetical protein